MRVVSFLDGVILSFLGQCGSNDHKITLEIKFTLQKFASGLTWNIAFVLKVRVHVLFYVISKLNSGSIILHYIEGKEFLNIISLLATFTNEV